jgi:hypothetical protein
VRGSERSAPRPCSGGKVSERQQAGPLGRSACRGLGPRCALRRPSPGAAAPRGGGGGVRYAGAVAERSCGGPQWLRARSPLRAGDRSSAVHSRSASGLEPEV